MIQCGVEQSKQLYQALSYRISQVSDFKNSCRSFSQNFRPPSMEREKFSLALLTIFFSARSTATSLKLFDENISFRLNKRKKSSIATQTQNLPLSVFGIHSDAATTLFSMIIFVIMCQKRREWCRKFDILGKTNPKMTSSWIQLKLQLHSRIIAPLVSVRKLKMEKRVNLGLNFF